MEILLAFSVSILAISAIVFGVTTSLSNVQYAKNQGLANLYAQEGMAVVRKIRDSSWNNFKNLADFYQTNTTYCLDQDSTELTPIVSVSSVPCEKNINGFFSREVKFGHNSSSCCSDNPCSLASVKGSKTTVTVSWSDNKCPVGVGNPLCHKVELITCFSNIDLRLTP